MKIDRKVKVFISSKCGGNYTVVRKSIKTLLEETGVCEVYIFEDDYGLSMPVQEAYIGELECSDVIIVVIDNFDGVTDPVQLEINRARELHKKIIYIFCDEHKKETTVLQNELRESLLEKYVPCHQFAEIPELAYNSFFNDLTKQYRFQHNSHLQDKKEGETTLTIDSLSEIDFNVKKETINNIKSVAFLLKQKSGICFMDGQPDSDDKLDVFMGDLLRVMLGEKTISELNFEPLRQYLKQVYNNELDYVVDQRVEALIYFFSGKYQDAYDVLKGLIDTHRDDMSKWVLNDTAIDLRNIEATINQAKGIWVISSAGQQILDEDENCLFNPVVDRFNVDFYKEIFDYELGCKVESADTVHLGGQDRFFHILAESFIASVNSISITHMRLVRSKIAKLFATLSFEYRNHQLFLCTIKMLILDGNDKELRKYVNAYGEYTNRISAVDISDIQNMVNIIPDDYSRIHSQSILLEVFGYYYDDLLFESVYNNYQAFIKNTLLSNKMAVPSILKAYKNIERRINTYDIVQIVHLVFDNKWSRWYDDALGVLRDLDTLQELDIKERKELLSWIINIMESDELRKQCNSIFEVAQSIRLAFGEDAKEIDKYVKKFAKLFFERTYYINIYQHSAEEKTKIIMKLLKSAHSDNMTQGLDGSYSQSVYNDYQTIGNILLSENVKLSSQDMKKINNVIKETLSLKRQTCEAKYYALRLLLILKLVFPRSTQSVNVLKNIDSFEDIYGEDHMFLQKRYSKNSLYVLWKIARISLLGDESSSIIADICMCNESEQIAIMDSLCVLSRYANKALIGEFFEIIWPTLLMLEGSLNNRIRFLVIAIYSNLYKTKLRNKAIERISLQLDSATESMMIATISRLKAANAEGEVVDYIYQKGRIDNNYCVREVANR